LFLIRVLLYGAWQLTYLCSTLILQARDGGALHLECHYGRIVTMNVDKTDCQSDGGQRRKRLHEA